MGFLSPGNRARSKTDLSQSRPPGDPTRTGGGGPATVLATKFANSTNLKDRLVSSATGLSKEWGKKSKGASDNPIKLPTTILGVKVPRKSGVAFGVPLERVVEETRIPLYEDHYRKRDTDEVTGDEARRWLPAVAVRCFEYLEEWGKKEEGIYRVPGSSYQIAQLRALFDAGMDLDLREIHPGDLDPHGGKEEKLGKLGTEERETK
ncbi:hypothetical protein RQP46_006248 [Phenoliferia psychrophenolica]